MDEFMKALDLLYSDIQPDMSGIKEVKMNAFDDIVVYKDGTEKIVYHCCD